MKHVWISVELLGDARRIERRRAGSIWQGIAFRLPETSRSFGTPQFVLQILVNFYNFLFFFVVFVKKWPATLAHFVIAQSRIACSVFITPSQQLQQ